jgi:hypothetical protein
VFLQSSKHVSRTLSTVTYEWIGLISFSKLSKRLSRSLSTVSETQSNSKSKGSMYRIRAEALLTRYTPLSGT